MIQNCKTCALLVSKGNDRICGLGRYKVEPEADYCSHHQTTRVTCEICGSILLSPGILDLVDDTPHTICPQCLSLLGTCNLCDHAKVCAFESSPSTLPKTVHKTIQRGPMQATVEIMNPDRIQETCKKDCTCWDDECGCLRTQSGQTCGKVVYTYAEKES